MRRTQRDSQRQLRCASGRSHQQQIREIAAADGEQYAQDYVEDGQPSWGWRSCTHKGPWVRRGRRGADGALEIDSNLLGLGFHGDDGLRKCKILVTGRPRELEK